MLLLYHLGLLVLVVAVEVALQQVVHQVPVEMVGWVHCLEGLRQARLEERWQATGQIIWLPTH